MRTNNLGDIAIIFTGVAAIMTTGSLVATGTNMLSKKIISGFKAYTMLNYMANSNFSKYDGSLCFSANDDQKLCNLYYGFSKHYQDKGIREPFINLRLGMLNIDRSLGFPLFNLLLSAASLLSLFAFPYASLSARILHGLVFLGLHYSPMTNTWPKFFAGISLCTLVASLESQAMTFMLRFACTCISKYLIDSFQDNPLDAFISYTIDEKIIPKAVTSINNLPNLEVFTDRIQEAFDKKPIDTHPGDPSNLINMRSDLNQSTLHSKIKLLMKVGIEKSQLKNINTEAESNVSAIFNELKNIEEEFKTQTFKEKDYVKKIKSIALALECLPISI